MFSSENVTATILLIVTDTLFWKLLYKVNFFEEFRIFNFYSARSQAFNFSHAHLTSYFTLSRILSREASIMACLLALFETGGLAGSIRLARFSRRPCSSHLEPLARSSNRPGRTACDCVSGRWAWEPQNYARRDPDCRTRENYHFSAPR